MDSAEAKENGGRNLNPSRHKHELCWNEGLPRYTCNGCKLFGANKGYKCRSCAKFTLHKACANSGDEAFHNNVQLRFRRKTIGSHSCDACGEFLKGFLFESSSRDLRLHPLCMSLPEIFIYSGHKEHSLQLVRETENAYTCSQCREKYSGWRYRCAETKCRVIVDLNCCIIDIYNQKGISKVVRTSRRKRILRKVFNGCKTMTGAAMKGTFEGLGTGLVSVAVGGVVVAGAADPGADNNDEEIDEDEEEQIDEDEEAEDVDEEGEI